MRGTRLFQAFHVFTPNFNAGERQDSTTMKPKPRNKPPFLQQKTTGRVFPYTVELEQYRTDMVPFWGTQEEANAANERIRLDRARKRNAAAVGMGITQPVTHNATNQVEPVPSAEMSPPFADLLPAGALGPPDVMPMTATPTASKGGLLSSVAGGVEPTAQGDTQEEFESRHAVTPTLEERGMEYLKTIEGDMSKLREYGRNHFNVKFPPSTTMDVIFKELVLLGAAGPMETIELDSPVDPQE